MRVSTFKELVVWQKSMVLVDNIYQLTSRFPTKEQYALSSQMQRSAISIPSNISEGWARNHKLEFIRFLSIAFGSACELETQLLIAQKQYESALYPSISALLLEVQKMLTSMMKSIRETPTKW